MLALVWLSVFESDGNGGRRWPNDSLLRHCAERIAARLTETDALAHLGGSDFAVLVNSVEHPADAVRFAREMLDAFRRPFLGGPTQQQARVTMGVAVHPNDGHLPGRLLQAARAAAERADNGLPERRRRLAFSSAKLNGEAAPPGADPNGPLRCADARRVRPSLPADTAPARATRSPRSRRSSAGSTWTSDASRRTSSSPPPSAVARSSRSASG